MAPPRNDSDNTVAIALFAIALLAGNLAPVQQMVSSVVANPGELVLKG